MRRGPYRESERGLECVYLAYGFGKGQGMPDLSDCLVERDHDRPWLLTIWEPILTTAPSPQLARAHCCYIATVIFYDRQYRRWPYPRIWRSNSGYHVNSKPGLLQWDQVETRLRGDDIVRFDGQEWKIGGGRVVWARKRWWMVHQVRRHERPALRVVA